MAGSNSGQPAAEEKGKRSRGFAAMSKDRRREIARKGGEAVSENRAHMAEIGKKGGESISENRAHMAEIGRKGGEASGGVTRTRKQTEQSS